MNNSSFVQLARIWIGPLPFVLIYGAEECEAILGSSKVGLIHSYRRYPTFLVLIVDANQIVSLQLSFSMDRPRITYQVRLNLNVDV